MKDQLEDNIPATEIGDEELREIAIKKFTQYHSVFKALAEHDTFRKKELKEIIDEDFERYDDVFKALS